MFIYNTTIKVDWSIQEKWLQWMKEEQIPAMLSNPVFHGYQLVKLLQVDETDGPTYAVQYHAHRLEELNDWLANISTLELADINKKWGDSIITFATIMEVVD